MLNKTSFEPLRHLVFARQDMPPVAAERFSTGVTLLGYPLPTALELGITLRCSP